MLTSFSDPEQSTDYSNRDRGRILVSEKRLLDRAIRACKLPKPTGILGNRDRLIHLAPGATLEAEFAVKAENFG